MGLIPDPTQPDHTQVQNDWDTRDRPRLPQALESQCTDNLAGSRRDASAEREMRALIGLIAPPLCALFREP
jgi:hypothetical protein